MAVADSDRYVFGQQLRLNTSAKLGQLFRGQTQNDAV